MMDRGGVTFLPRGASKAVPVSTGTREVPMQTRIRVAVILLLAGAALPALAEKMGSRSRRGPPPTTALR